MAQEAFPLHFLVWNNQYLELDRELQKKEVRGGGYLAAGGVWQTRLLGRAALRWCCSCVCGSAAGCGAPGSEGAHPAGAGCVSGPPGVNPGAAQALCGPHTLQRTGLDQWVLSAVAPSFMSWGCWGEEEEEKAPTVIKCGCMFQSCRRRWAPGTLSWFSWCFSTETSSAPLRDWRASQSCSAN